MKELFEKNKICAIIRNVPTEKIEGYLEAAYHGGIRMYEFAMNSDNACELIQIARRLYDDKIVIGAGTVINEARRVSAFEAGAEFFLTPSVNIHTIEYCLKHGIKVLPGVLTPTDVDICTSYGINTMKLFPAGEMPDSYIKSIKGPFNGTNYIAVGGVSRDNITEFFKQGYIGVGIGSNMIARQYVETNDWQRAESYVREMVMSVEGVQ